MLPLDRISPLKDRAEISIIVPVYNEEDNVVPLYQEIVQALKVENVCFEVIFVDDGSTDKTSDRLQMLRTEALNLRVVQHARNYGQSASIFSGAKAAIYPLLITLDGDGQNDPKDIAKLIVSFQQNTSEKPQNAERSTFSKPCVVFGMRAKRKDSLWRIIASRVSNGVRQWLLKDHCTDTGCSLKLFPRQAFLELPHFNHCHRFLPALFQRAGFELINIPVNHRPRQHGQSKYGTFDRLWVGIHDLMGMHWLVKRPCKPEILSDEH
ncbi:MAG: glycosyltransferase family 2 protein [Legionella sp.]|nr:glycosyltransferase family 2 protein [Legionella sp.]